MSFISCIFLFSVLPGDPARMMLDQREDADQIKVINKKYAFDRPIFDQYILYVNDVSPISIHYESSEHLHLYQITNTNTLNFYLLKIIV